MTQTEHRTRWWKFGLWLLVVLLLWWSLRQVNWIETLRILSDVRGIEWAALLALNLVVLASFSGRWWSILRGYELRIPYLTVAVYRLMGAGISYFTPGPHIGGEPLQVLLLEKRHQITRSAAIGTVAIDKLFELLVNASMLTVGCITLIWVGVFPAVGIEGLVLPLILLALPAVYLMRLAQGALPLTAILQRSGLSWAKGTLAEGERQMGQFCKTQPKALILVMLFSLVSWLGILLEVWLALTILGLSLTLVEVILIITAGRLAILLPAPGGLGTFEASQVLIFTALGLAPAAALGLSVLVRARDLLFMGGGFLAATYAIQTQKISFGKNLVHE